MTDRVYVPMVYIVTQLKKGAQPHRRHIGAQVKIDDVQRWIPLCQLDRDNPSKCEYQYKVDLIRIDCADCLAKRKKLGIKP